MSDTEWRAHHYMSHGRQVWRVVEWSDTGRALRTVTDNLDKPTACRIAAVNELEAALDDMIVSYEHEASMDNPALLRARAALAKARGET